MLRDRGGAIAALPLKQMNLASSPVTSPLPAALGPDGAFGGSSDGLGLDFSAAAAAPQSYVDAIRTGLDASAQDQGWAQFYSCLGGGFEKCHPKQIFFCFCSPSAAG